MSWTPARVHWYETSPHEFLDLLGKKKFVLFYGPGTARYQEGDFVRIVPPHQQPVCLARITSVTEYSHPEAVPDRPSEYQNVRYRSVYIASIRLIPDVPATLPADAITRPLWTGFYTGVGAAAVLAFLALSVTQWLGAAG